MPALAEVRKPLAGVVPRSTVYRVPVPSGAELKVPAVEKRKGIAGYLAASTLWSGLAE